MKNIKFNAIALSALLLLSGCNTNNATKGGLIGGGGGALLGGIVGNLIGKNAGGTAIGAAIGGAIGSGAGILIGKKMDKAKAAAEAVANAQVESVTDANGLQAVKVTFDSGILFATGQSTLSQTAKNSLTQFATNVLNANRDIDVAIYGFASSDGDETKNLTLSQNRANAVRSYLTNTCGVNAGQLKEVTGYGENPQYLIYGANGQEDRAASRRVEVYLYASEAMINAANNGTLQ